MTQKEAEVAQREAALAGQGNAQAIEAVRLQQETAALAVQRQEMQVQHEAERQALVAEGAHLEALAGQLAATEQRLQTDAQSQEVIAEMLDNWATHLQDRQALVQQQAQEVQRMKLLLGWAALLEGVVFLVVAVLLLLAWRRQQQRKTASRLPGNAPAPRRERLVPGQPGITYRRRETQMRSI